MAGRASKTKPLGRAKPATKVKVKIGKADKPVKKAFPLIGRADLMRLIEQAAIFRNRTTTANGALGELISDYVKRKHLHTGAFRMATSLLRIGERDPQALWLHLAHFDDMRAKIGLDKMAKAQGQLLPPISDEDSDNVQTDLLSDDVAEDTNVYSYPVREVAEQAGAA